MTFAHLSLLAGLAVVTLPIMLHLFGQRQPQAVDFPALRFVRQTAVEQSTSWQLRHVLLLLFRILLLGLLALALAQPRVHNALFGSVLGSVGTAVLGGMLLLAAAVAYATHRPRSVWFTCLCSGLVLWGIAGAWGVQSYRNGPKIPATNTTAPVAVAIVLDNSPSLGYVFENQARWDRAKEMATWILGQLPSDSHVGILSGSPVRSLGLTPAAAESLVERASLRGRTVDLASRLRLAVELVSQDELERKEVYVITDLDRQAWEGTAAELADYLRTKSDEVLVQIVDVGGPAEANWRLGDVSLSAQGVPVGGNVSMQVAISRPPRPAAGNTVTVELLQEAFDPRLPIVRNGELETAPRNVVDRQVIDMTDRDVAEVELTAHDLPSGTHHFIIRHDQPDPLAIDNERFATIEAYEQRPVLIVADDDAIGRMMQLIVDPRVDRGIDDGEGTTAHVHYWQLASSQLENYGVVCLYDPPDLEAAVASKIRAHIAQGRGLLVILGEQARQSVGTDGGGLHDLLPGRLAEIVNMVPAAFLDAVTTRHPLYHVFGDTVADIPWGQFPVLRCWRFDPMAGDAQVLMQISGQNMPLIVEHAIDHGRVITIGSLFPQADTGKERLWNGLWATDDPWVGFGLLLGAMRTLAIGEEQVLNWPTGAIVTLRNDTRRFPSRWQLYLPDGQTRRVDTTEGSMNLGSFDNPGIYRMRGLRGEPVARGFSVNTPSRDTMLQRLETDELAELLGEGTFRLARTHRELESSIGTARYGVELYPLVMLFVMALFVIEQAMSNRFYQIRFRRYAGE